MQYFTATSIASIIVDVTVYAAAICNCRLTEQRRSRSFESTLVSLAPVLVAVRLYTPAVLCVMPLSSYPCNWTLARLVQCTVCLRWEKIISTAVVPSKGVHGRFTIINFKCYNASNGKILIWFDLVAGYNCKQTAIPREQFVPKHQLQTTSKCCGIRLGGPSLDLVDTRPWK